MREIKIALINFLPKEKYSLKYQSSIRVEQLL
jgi:hypothetical protein